MKLKYFKFSFDVDLLTGPAIMKVFKHLLTKIKGLIKGKVSEILLYIIIQHILYESYSMITYTLEPENHQKI